MRRRMLTQPGRRRSVEEPQGYLRRPRGNVTMWTRSVRRLSGDATLLLTPLWPVVLDHVILTARVAAVAGHAGLRTSLLDTISLLERERPRVTLFTAIGQHARGILSGNSNDLVVAANSLQSSSRPLLHAGAAEDAGQALASMDRTTEARDQLKRLSIRTPIAEPSPTRGGSAGCYADWASNDAWLLITAQRPAGTASQNPS